jgi:hypothetical protein
MQLIEKEELVKPIVSAPQSPAVLRARMSAVQHSRISHQKKGIEAIAHFGANFGAKSTP